MPREVAHPYLLAAAEAWPFASEPAYRRCTLRLARTPQHLFDPPTQALAAELVDWLRPRAAGRSLDALQHLCDYAWFNDAPRAHSLADTLHRLAGRTLQHAGGEIALCRDSDFPERLEHFRWLSLLLPPDLLVSAFTDHPTTDRVSLQSPQLTQLLTESPVAETHVHLNAAMSFPLVWTGLTSAFAHHAPSPGDLPDDPATPFTDRGRFLSILTAALITRLLLARFLWSRAAAAAPDTFTDIDLPNIAAHLRWPGGHTAATAALRGALRLLVTGEPSNALSYPHLQLLYRLLLGPTSLRRAQSLAQLAERDPLAAWLSPTPGAALVETRFAARALAYLRGPGHQDNHFACAFWQYTRVRCLTYRYLVQEPGTAGLDWFKRHFDRLRALRRALGDCRIEAALAHASPGIQLASMELRISPEASVASMRAEIRGLRRQVENHRHSLDLPHVALLAHFLKERVNDSTRLHRLHADPRQLMHHARFGAWAFKRITEALAIESLLDRSPHALFHLRGLDVASTELAVPTWAVKPAFVRARRASLRASERLARLGLHAPPMRATIHAGEDYLRLIEGLRRVHEPIEFGLLDVGDRLGHGFALGHDPERWARGAATVMQPAEDRLDDLLWELDRYGSGDLGVDSGRFAFARAEALRLGRIIYGEHTDVDALVEARRWRHHLDWLTRIGFPFVRRFPFDRGSPEQLAYAYLTNPRVFLRGQRVEEVRATPAEITLLRAAQSYLRRELSRLEITVESNPSSNVLIGDLLSVEEHPSFRLAPLPGRPTPEGDCPVLLSINTDDPITFATSLADEYAHLYGALLRSHVPAHDALTWLRARRDEGYRSRMTLPESGR